MSIQELGIGEMDTIRELGVSWYAIRTRSRHEKVVRDQLAGRGIEQLLPTFIKTSQWKDRKKTIQVPLFPGYCFARFSLHDRLPVLQVPGVVEIVGQANSPEPIPEQDIDAIKTITSLSPVPQYHPCPYLSAGTRIRVVRGPFRGLRGVLLRKANEYRLVISVHMICQAVSVEIEATDIGPDHQSDC